MPSSISYAWFCFKRVSYFPQKKLNDILNNFSIQSSTRNSSAPQKTQALCPFIPATSVNLRSRRWLRRISSKLTINYERRENINPYCHYHFYCRLCIPLLCSRGFLERSG